jgi:hypothetical protein
VVAPQEISGALAAGNFQGLAEAEPAWAAVG